jgi:hypothetical protein
MKTWLKLTLSDSRTLSEVFESKHGVIRTVNV